MYVVCLNLTCFFKNFDKSSKYYLDMSILHQESTLNIGQEKGLTECTAWPCSTFS